MNVDGSSPASVDDRLGAFKVQVGSGGPGDTVRDVLRTALGDPRLELVYLRVGTGGWGDELGRSTTTTTFDPDLAFTPIERDGRPVAGLIHDPELLRDPERLLDATRAASLAMDNERLKAELRAELAEVQASRARIAAAGDAELRRLERNLHDGAQQRLVGLSLMLRMAARYAIGDTAIAELLADSARELEDALTELRDLTRGIQPAVVSDAGLEGALESLAERPGIPVDLDVNLPDRLPEPVEIGAFYVVAEALTNANKHASATRAALRATVVDHVLQVTVNDDGCGGATPMPGSGLAGLADRVATLGGELVIDSPPGVGTTIVVHLPVSQPLVPEDDRRRTTALKWIGWENWKAPSELYEQITDEDNWTASRLMLVLSGGNAGLTVREREWLAGYLTAAHSAPWVVETGTSYDDSDTIDDLLQIPGVPMILRGNLYDALRMCASDGPITPHELDRIRRVAGSAGIPSEVVTELHEIVAAEETLRERRFELIVKPVLYGSLGDAGL